MLSLLFLVLLSLLGCSVSDDVRITKNVPPTVLEGEEFEFSVVVYNDGKKSHELRSIDVDTVFLDGIFVTETIPATREEYDAFGQHIFEFKKTIPPQSTEVVTFKAKAITSGDFSGDFDICIDGDASCLFNSIRIVVLETN